MIVDCTPQFINFRFYARLQTVIFKQSLLKIVGEVHNRLDFDLTVKIKYSLHLTCFFAYVSFLLKPINSIKLFAWRLMDSN